MPNQTRRSTAPLPLTFLLGVCVLSGASATGHASEPRTVNGPAVPLFGATIATWGKLDADGKILEAGLTLPYAVIENAPAAADPGAEFKADAVVEFPKEVQETTFLNHLGLFWEPHGHEPEGRYTTPHVDFHFFTVLPAEASAVDCSKLETRAPELVPAGWVPAVPPGADPRSSVCR